MMKYRVYIKDIETEEENNFVIEARRNVAIKTVILNGVKKFVENYPDPTEFMREVKAIHREAYDTEDFVESLLQDLDFRIGLGDLNNHEYIKSENGEERTTTAYDVGYDSYKRAWEDQLDGKDCELVLEKYLPADIEVIIEHGNEIMSEYEEWVIVTD